MELTIPELELEYDENKISKDLLNNISVRGFLRKNDVRINQNGSKIVNFLKEKSVFITGGSGFLGKLLIEKLLRSCEDLKCIYVMLREKRGENIQSRLNKLTDNLVFGPLLKLQPNFKEKLIPISGDCALPGLGLSAENRKILIDKVNIIYHSAATVRFDEKLKLAVAINVKGTMEIVQLARECKSIESIVHVSTAYTNCNRSEIDEIFYDTTLLPQNLIDLVDSRCDDDLAKLTQSIIGTWPNTYTFTKAIAEIYIKDNTKGLPICVFRPAIVIPTVKEPLYNWSENINGPNGFLLGGGTGFIRAMYLNMELRQEYVPADYVINGIIAASYANTKSDKVMIYNYVSSPENPIDNRTVHDRVKEMGETAPSTMMMWYIDTYITTNYPLYMISAFFLHTIPAYIIDIICALKKKPRRMLKMYGKVHKGMKLLSFFTSNEWDWKNTNTQKLWNSITKEDQMAFPFSMGNLNWLDYLRFYWINARVYILNDPINTVPEGLKKFKRLATNLLSYVKYTRAENILNQVPLYSGAVNSIEVALWKQIKTIGS